MEWLETDYQTINQKNKFLFLNKIKSNQNPTILNCYIFNESNNPNQDLYFLTDLKIRLKVKLSPKRVKLIRPFYTTPTDDVKFIKIYLKQFLYSTMINFRNSKEQFIFMMIEDFDLKSDEPALVDKYEIQKLTRWDHLLPPGIISNQKFYSSIELKSDKDKSNLSLLVENLSPAYSGQNNDYTIQIVTKEKTKKPTDLNEAFANDTTTDSNLTTNSSSNKSIEPSFVNTLDPKVSSQIDPVEPHIDCSIIVKSSIHIEKIQNLTDDEDDNNNYAANGYIDDDNDDDEEEEDNNNVSKTFQFSPKLCNSHFNFIRETQQSTNSQNETVKKRRKLLEDKCAEELNQEANMSLISNECESPKPSGRVNRTYSTCSSASTSSSSLSFSSCVTPKSGFFKPKLAIKSEPRHIGQIKKAKNSHLIFSPIKTKPERQEKLKEIKKNFMSNSTRNMYKQLNSPAKLNSVLVDKILNFNKNIISSDDDDDDDYDNEIDHVDTKLNNVLQANTKTKSLLSLNQMRRRRLLFDKSNQLKQLEKVFDSDKSIPSGQNQNDLKSHASASPLANNNNNNNNTNNNSSISGSCSSNSIQIGLLNYKFLSSSQTDDKLQEYLINLAQMTQKSSNNASNDSLKKSSII